MRRVIFLFFIFLFFLRTSSARGGGGGGGREGGAARLFFVSFSLFSRPRALNVRNNNNNNNNNNKQQRYHAFEHKSYFGKNRTHDFRKSRCAGYLLDHDKVLDPLPRSSIQNSGIRKWRSEHVVHHAAS